MKKRVLSGIRASGRLHLGNYLGAVKGMVALQEDPNYETFYMVADLHTINSPYDPVTLRDKIYEVLLDYLAIGLDPEKTTIFVQSHVPEHIELSYLFSTVLTVARMLHIPTYKDKIKENAANANMAMLYYPPLMAADILAYKANEVPVGDDQLAHLEVSREVARKMNEKYGTDFPQPIQFKTSGRYIPSLLGVGKMSKSIEGSYINLADSLEEIEAKLAKVPTDLGRGESLPKERGVAVLLKLIELFEGEKKRKDYENQYLREGIKYSNLKKELAKAIFKDLRPIQEKREKLEKESRYVDKVINEGARKARIIAQATLKEVKEKMGLL